MEIAHEEIGEEIEEKEQNVEKDGLKTCKTSKEAGIIYLSKIPQYMSVKKVKQIFEHYGELGRVFLQPDDKAVGSKKGRLFTEGWVEYKDKRVAKRVALSLNNTMIGGKRHSQWYDQLWNIKYLHRFKWTHLNERLAYEKAVHQQRLRTEIAQVKRETNFHIHNMERNQRLKKKKAKEQKQSKEKSDGDGNNSKQENAEREFEFKQRQTEDEILSRKRKQEEIIQSDSLPKERKQFMKKPITKHLSKKSFLKNIFSGGLAAADDE